MNGSLRTRILRNQKILNKNEKSWYIEQKKKAQFFLSHIKELKKKFKYLNNNKIS